MAATTTAEEICVQGWGWLSQPLQERSVFKDGDSCHNHCRKDLCSRMNFKTGD